MCGAFNLSPFSSKYPIAYVEICVFSHATEDLQKVENAVRNILPEELTAEVFNKTACVGHYGNPIVLLETKITDRPVLPSIIEKIASALSPLDKDQLSQEIKMHVEKHTLYLRFDKQNAFLGELKLTSNDPIRLKIHFKNRTPDEIIELCKKAGLLP